MNINITIRVLMKISYTHVYKYGENDHNSKCSFKFYRNLTKRYHMVVEYTQCRVKKSPNLPILRLIHELKGIMVNKGRIYGELGKYERYL